jgi:membrane-bound lytic murein transglycosylase B
VKIDKIYSLTLSILLLSACSTKNIEKKEPIKEEVIQEEEHNQTAFLNRYQDEHFPFLEVSAATDVNLSEDLPLPEISYDELKGEFQGNYKLLEFIDMMVAIHGFDRKYLNEIFSQARDYNLIPKTISCTSSLASSRIGAWDRYRNCFIYERNIERGIKFWNEHEATLNEAEAKYGIPAKYIIGILGIETAYGVNFGKYRVIDVLTTRSMLGDRRADFYTDELEKYLLITRDIGLDPTEIMGSTSGALGYGQFMPSSYMRFAVDFNNDGKIDLWNAEDAIGSIANYFAENGWNSSIPKVAVRARYRGNRFKRLKTGYKTKYSLYRLKKKYHIIPREKFNPHGRVSLIKLPRGTYDELWLGSPNFRVITTYNHNTYYGMTAYQLGEEIAKRRDGKG